MRQVFYTCLALALELALSGCSIYESPGRKYLEQNSYQFAGVAAQQNLLECGDRPLEDGWKVVDDGAKAQASSREDFALRVHAKSAESQALEPYACDFQFESADELAGKVSAAVELTTAMHDSTGR